MVKWIEPRTWVSGETMTYAAMNTLSDQLQYLKERDRVHCYNTDEQDIKNDRWDRLNWSDDKYDNNDMHFSRRRPALVQIRRDGIYMIILKVNFANAATGQRRTMLRRNSGGEPTGGQSLGIYAARLATTGVTTVHAQRLARLDRGDNICAFARQSSGGTIDVNGGKETSFLQVLQVASIP